MFGQSGNPGSGLLPGATADPKAAFLEATRAAREERALVRHRESAVVTIQSTVRGWLDRIRLRRKILQDFDDCFPIEVEDETGATSTVTLKPAVVCYRSASNFLRLCNPLSHPDHSARFERFCRYTLASLDSESPKTSYVSVALNKDLALAWIAHMKVVLLACAKRLDRVDLEAAAVPATTNAEARTLNTLLRMLVSFTSTSTWAALRAKSMEKLLPGMNQLCANFLGHLVQDEFLGLLRKLLLRGLCGSRVLLKKTSVSAIMTLAMRPVIGANFSDKLVSMLILNILCLPGLIFRFWAMSSDSLVLLQKHNILTKVASLLTQEQQMKIHFNALEGSYALCLTANLVHLTSLLTESDVEEGRVDLFQLTMVITGLLESCGQYVNAKKSNLSHWHPVLGWFSVSLDSYLQDSMERVRQQLAKLWSLPVLKIMMIPLVELEAKLPELSSVPTAAAEVLLPQETSGAKQLFRKALEKTKGSAAATSSPGSASAPVPKGGYTKLGSPECTKIATMCTMYEAALKTLSQLKLDILAGLCYHNILLIPLWKLIQSVGPQCGLKTFLDLLALNPKHPAPEFQLLVLFCDCLSYVVTILDDIELYEKQAPFTLSQYVRISGFLNTFLFRSVSGGLLSDDKAPLFASLHGLLMVIYSRDNRRQLAPRGHWLIKEIRIANFMSDLEKSRKSTLLLIQKLPHVIPHEDRVLLFRRRITAEKATLGVTAASRLGDVPSTPARTSRLITVHRTRIVEDGYRQLSTLTSAALKGVIRVKFVNLQGLDEAGIDQDGVFKEFLEETIKRVFDPGLNLFCSTSEGGLYPSPMSQMTENHLQLFEFTGKMIGKAVYEGIVVDVPFAPFFLSQVLGKVHAAFYSYVDDLPSMDPELYRNLTYMKHYEGDVADLDLTFSFDQDMMGQIVTHELIPGGRGVAVTNDNKISYMHHIANFRMHTQIREQTAAFTQGFRAIIPTDWLSLFSTPEVQRLISGDNTPMDLRDLRRHTHYYGGFHDSHKVIVWLWDILEKEFDPKERVAFLKFVTSCSKPPLLGFEHLEPPFSIRCVEVGDDEDDGDTLGSVLRGFLALRRKDPVNRLPTASTCFNLLKLPNYQKKSTLKEKLRYAISCNTGFELS